jgi:murein DD-endopeptidase MepM/ murein hydrolase activator NlpD
MLLCPLKNPCRLTQKFGERPEVYSQFGLKGHNGLDYADKVAGTKAPLYAPMEGIVKVVADQGKAGYGKYIRIVNTTPDEQGRFKEVTLGHFDSIEVKQGQFIALGARVGIMGSTGFSTAVHVHFGLRHLDANGNVLKLDNGYKGSVDFLQYVISW